MPIWLLPSWTLARAIAASSADSDARRSANQRVLRGPGMATMSPLRFRSPRHRKSITLQGLVVVPEPPSHWLDQRTAHPAPLATKCPRRSRQPLEPDPGWNLLRARATEQTDISASTVVMTALWHSTPSAGHSSVKSLTPAGLSFRGPSASRRWLRSNRRCTSDCGARNAVREIIRWA